MSRQHCGLIDEQSVHTRCMGCSSLPTPESLSQRRGWRLLTFEFHQVNTHSRQSQMSDAANAMARVHLRKSRTVTERIAALAAHICQAGLISVTPHPYPA